MDKSQLCVIASLMFNTIALFQIFEHGFNTFAIICLSLGSLMLCLYAKNKTNNKK